MENKCQIIYRRLAWLTIALIIGMTVGVGLLWATQSYSQRVMAAPVPPPEGYPKLSLSTKIVSPTLAGSGGETLYYTVEIRNTGAYAAEGTMFIDVIPTDTVYNGDAQSSVLPIPEFANGYLTWLGDVGFDSSVILSFSVNISPTFTGTVKNQAVITHPLLSKPVTVTAETVVTDLPILVIEKVSEVDKPGANKPLTYSLTVRNEGQPAVGIPLTVTDYVPLDTSVLLVGQDGVYDPGGGTITWQRVVSLETSAESIFTFTVEVDTVPSGTVITNEDYWVESEETGVTYGDVYTLTVVDPILSVSKSIYPDPPGSNRELTYTLSIINMGSMATDLEIRDWVPEGVIYVRGGIYSNGEVLWTLPQLDTGETATFTFTVYVNDVAYILVANEDYSVCSAEGVCTSGDILKSFVDGPNFVVTAQLDPIAKKPGGGGGPVTPTLTIENLGPGNALDARAYLEFGRISVSNIDHLVAYPPGGTFSYGPDCGENCRSYYWDGDIEYGDMVTITTIVGQSTIGGDEGTPYTTTIEIVDTLGITTTQPVTAMAIGHITHYANLVPYKSAPTYIGAGQVMTYTLKVFNSGLSTDVPPYPWVTDTVPLSTSLVRVSDNGSVFQVGERTVISWELPAMSPGDTYYRRFSVQTNPDLVSGTMIVNRDFRTYWFNIEGGSIYSNTGEPVTTTVREIGLVDSYKEVSPRIASPGEGILLTYTVHVVNTSPMEMMGVEVDDILPWESSTYQRDATVSSGDVTSDIVSIHWTGDVAEYSSELITFTVLVDDFYEGPVTNTATIHHPSLREDKIVEAVAWITDDPVLRISKHATPDPVMLGEELEYVLTVENLGQQASSLVVTDTLPDNVEYVEGSASSSGSLTGGQMRWEFVFLRPLEKRSFTFRVRVLEGEIVANEYYRVSCAEGAAFMGPPLFTTVTQPPDFHQFMPIVQRR